MPSPLNSGHPHRRAIVIALVAIAVEVSGVALRGWGLGGTVVVRCRRGHLFTTLWIPGASITSLRLGWWRVQRCPVGGHWSLVSPVLKSSLTQEQAAVAAARVDVRLP